MDAARRRVQRELADRDGHAARALVAEAQDPFVVGDDDEPDVLVRALAQELRDPVAIGRGDPGAAGPPDDVAELLARPAHGRRVDDRQELIEVFGQQPVEQRRVAVLERRQPDVLLERVVLDPDVLELEVDLLVDRQHAVRQQPAKPERVALGRRERQVLRQQPAAKQGRARELDLGRAAGRDGIERGGEGTHASEHTGRGGPSGAVARPGPPDAARVSRRSRSACRPSRTPRVRAGGRCTGTRPVSRTRSSSCGSSRPGCSPRSAARRATGSVPFRWRSWTPSSPTIHSWSIGSSLRRTIVIGTPAWTVIVGRSKCEYRIGRSTDTGPAEVGSAQAHAIAVTPQGERDAADQGEPPRSTTLRWSLSWPRIS